MGKLIYTQGKFRFEALNASERTQAKFWGFQKDADTLQWVTRNPRKAVELRRWADISAEQKFKKYFITDFPPPEQIVYPDHLEPKLFQIESAWHCVTRSPAYCADEAGLGKTIMACMCIATVPGKTVIICPPYLVHNWALELLKWTTNEENIAVMEGGKSLADDTKWHQPIVIIPDSLIINPLTQRMIAEQKFTWLFVDEAHRYKEANAQRTEALIDKLAPHSQRVCYLSGTPIPNGRPIELYPLLNGTAPESILWQSAEQYGIQFCNGKRVTRYEGQRAIAQWDFSGASNLPVLRTQLRKKLMIRHLKKDVLKELAPKTRKIIFLELNEQVTNRTRLYELEKQVLKNFTLDELMGEDHELGDIATYRREVGEAKTLSACIYIMTLLDESPEKLVVFAHHRAVVEKLVQMLKPMSPLMVRGGMTSKAKAEQVRLFQTEPKHRVIVGNLESMGTGNTLTRAPGVVVVEPDWRPGINEQAEDRVHRITQEKNVYVRYLVLRNSLDERMLTQVLQKQEAIDSVMN